MPFADVDVGAEVVEASVTWSYPTVLSVISLALAALLAWRSIHKGGWAMVKE